MRDRDNDRGSNNGSILHDTQDNGNSEGRRIQHIIIRNICRGSGRGGAEITRGVFSFAESLGPDRVMTVDLAQSWN